MTTKWLGSLGVVLGAWSGSVFGADDVWRPAASPPAIIARTPAPASSSPSVSLGRPVPLSASVLPPASSPTVHASVTPVVHNAPPTAPRPIIRAQAPDVPPPGVPAVPAVAPPVAIPGDPLGGPAIPNPAGITGSGQPWLGGGWMGTYEGAGRKCFQSDHCFDGFISPITSPFHFEDPRSLTELRPIFIHQQTPDKNSIYRGGDIDFFGLQARLAITERLSFVISKLGWVWSEPHNTGGDFNAHSGLGEIQMGPKYTFLRNDQTGTLGAAGLIFEIPSGASDVFQNTGQLSLRPFVTMGQNFGRSSYGSFNILGTVGASFGVDNQRTDYVFTGLHLDFDVGGLHKIYPTLELNWTHYTNSGNVRNLNFEGRDLFNFGSNRVSGNDFVSLAPGIRYKFCEWAQVGTAAEFPITGRRDLQDFRWTVDFILRY